jgi:predicted flap endonuclease-1-like 5' DNA nuclease
LTAIPGIGDVTAELLYQHGFKSAEEVAQSDEAALAEVDGIAAEKISTILLAAREHVEDVRRAAEEAAQAAAEAAAKAAAEAAEAAAEAANAPVEPTPVEPSSVMADLSPDDEGKLS